MRKVVSNCVPVSATRGVYCLQDTTICHLIRFQNEASGHLGQILLELASSIDTTNCLIDY